MTITDQTKPVRIVVVDPDKCTGSTLCMAWARHSFEVGPDLKTLAINPFTDSEAAILRAIAECPRHAVSFADDRS